MVDLKEQFLAILINEGTKLAGGIAKTVISRPPKREPIPLEELKALNEAEAKRVEEIINQTSLPTSQIASSPVCVPVQKFSEVEMDRLLKAQRLLEEFASETNCTWCGRKSREIAELINHLRKMRPIAEEMAKHVGPLESQKMEEFKKSIEKI
jgi:hypothetical protein